MSQRVIIIASVFGFLAVALGAFGAHGLHDKLFESGRLDDWEKAVDYQMYHALGLLLLGIWKRFDEGNKRIPRIVYIWTVGILFFSGSLYALGLGVPVKLIWPLTPLGGLLFLLGWLMLIPASCANKK
jgi:uncharacterized membrane protein YgdD (TMEM256/DUF423 family)